MLYGSRVYTSQFYPLIDVKQQEGIYSGPYLYTQTVDKRFCIWSNQSSGNTQAIALWMLVIS